MAVYKVIQDIEAEDKLLGPLTLKGFIYAIITVFCAFINFKLLVSTDLGLGRWVGIAMFLPPMVLFGVLASPLGGEQPTEVWLLSRIRFLFKPRKRLWDQSGIKELVTVTVPKKIEKHLTKDFTQSEVYSRLETLARTLDSRGWAVKNADLNMLDGNDLSEMHNNSDRLVGTGGVSPIAPVVDIHAADDMLDERNNPTAQHFENLVQQAESDRKKGLIDRLRAASVNSESDEAEMQQLASMQIQEFNRPTILRAEATQDIQEESALGQRLAKARQAFEAEHGSVQEPVAPVTSPAAPPVTAAQQAVKLELAQSGNDLSVASIAQLANRLNILPNQGEVVINLH